MPSAKIPIRQKGYGKDVRTFYHQIPFRDEVGGTLNQDISMVSTFAGEAAKINRARRGQFQKGNRTLGEYEDIQDNGDSTQQSSAMLLEDQFFTPLKHIVKINILQYQEPTELVEQGSQTAISIDPTKLRSSVIEFKMADGLEPKSKLLGVDATLQTFQIAATLEGANQEYDIMGMFAEAMDAKGSRLMKHKRKQQFIPMAPQQVQPTPAGNPTGSTTPQVPAV
jgi:hypothetical protein